MVNTRITGVFRRGNSLVKAATRLIDVFIGRVDINVTCDDLRKYFSDTLGMQVVSVNNLVIRTSEHQTFKVALKLSERERLFIPDPWFEDIITEK